jgi:hypothetical protein
MKQEQASVAQGSRKRKDDNLTTSSNSVKVEHPSFKGDMVLLNIHGRVSTHVTLDIVRRPRPPHFDLFDETLPPAHQQIEVYRHEIGWANRLILSDLLMLKEGKEGD